MHALMKLPELYRVVLVISQQGASGGSSSIGQPMSQDRNNGYCPLLLSHSTSFFLNTVLSVEIQNREVINLAADVV